MTSTERRTIDFSSNDHVIQDMTSIWNWKYIIDEGVQVDENDGEKVRRRERRDKEKYENGDEEGNERFAKLFTQSSGRLG